MSNTISQKSIKDAIVAYMNPYHILYIKTSPYNTLECLFKSLDQIESSRLKDILGIAYMFYESKAMSSRKADFNDVETMKKRLLNKSIDIANMTSEHVAVNAFTSIILNGFISTGNPLSVDDKKSRLQASVESMKYNKEELKEKVKAIVGVPCAEDDLEKDYQSAVNLMNESLQNMKTNQERYYQAYNDFCNITIKNLLEEDPLLI